jgi:DNA-binding XRE family transcriptional regulator
MKPQIITTPEGSELVVIPRAEYEELKIKANFADEEDDEDCALYDDRKAELASGQDTHLPPEVSAAMLRGECLLKALRNWRGVTQNQLAKQTNLAQGYISDLEAGRRKGTKETMTLIAQSLKINPQWITD